MSSLNTPVLDFKSATLYAVRLVLQSASTAVLIPALQSHLQEAGDFFDGEPVVIDATALSQAADWKVLAQTLANASMSLIGVAAPHALHSSIRRAGLAVVNLPAMRDPGAASGVSGSVHRDPPSPASAPADLVAGAPAANAVPDLSRPAALTSGAARNADLVVQPGLADEAPAALATPLEEGPRTTLVLDRSLRSGQKVYARGADLIVVGMVSPGAEVIADGNIHVYGPLRGKAMAGARGDESARIFTTHLDAELVAVAGVYRVVETRLPDDVLQRPAAVRLHGGELRIEALEV